MSVAFSLNFLYSVELLPTTIRARGFGVLNASGRIGSIIGMQVLKLGNTPTAWLFGGVSVIAAIATSMMSETFNQPLPQTLAEAELQMSGGIRSDSNKQGPTNFLIE